MKSKGYFPKKTVLRIYKEVPFGLGSLGNDSLTKK